MNLSFEQIKSITTGAVRIGFLFRDSHKSKKMLIKTEQKVSGNAHSALQE